MNQKNALSSHMQPAAEETTNCSGAYDGDPQELRSSA